MTPSPQDAISAGIMGAWAFLGAVMRGTTDWRDIKTGKFSPGQFVASIATALVLGQMAAALTQWLHWEGYATGAIAGTVGYLGPAVIMPFFQKRLLGGLDANPAAPKE